MRGSFRRSSLFLGATVLLCTALLICNLGGLPPAEASPRLRESNAPEDWPVESVMSLQDLTITGLPVSTGTLAGSDAVSGGEVLPVGSNGTITITLSANPTSIVANGTSTSTLTAALEGVSDGTVVTFTTTAGTFNGSDTITDTASGGSAQAILTSDTVAQTATVTAEVDSVIDTTVVAFTAGALDHFAVSVPSTGTAGVSFTTVITALDAYSNTVTSFTNTATLTTTNGGTISPTVTGAFNAGVWNGQVSLTTAGTGRTVIAQYGSAQGTGYVDIQHGAAQSVNLTPKDQTRTAGETITYDLNAADSYGNTWNVTASSEFTITWGAGGSWAGATYTTAKAGSWTVTGTHGALNDATGLIVNPGDPHTVAVTADPTSLVANGTDTATITATVRDAYENFVADGTNVTFQASLGSFPTMPYITTTTDGVATASLTGTVAGTSYITATAGSAEGYTTVEFEPGPLYRVVVSPASVELHPYDTQQFTARGYDQFNNEIPDPGLSWAVVNDGGTIDANGLFTAGTTIGPFTNTVAAGDGTITDTASVTVTNQAPTAVISGPDTGAEGSVLTWNASASSDPENDALTYAWDFGDGSTAGNVITVTHAYTDNADYTLTLTVTDAYDALDTTTQTVTISNVAPTVDEPNVVPAPSDEGSAVTASAAFSDAGADDGPFTCTVNYGDGSGELAGTVSGDTCTGPAHVYADNDFEYKISVTNDGIFPIREINLTVDLDDRLYLYEDNVSSDWQCGYHESGPEFTCRFDADGNTSAMMTQGDGSEFILKLRAPNPSNDTTMKVVSKAHIDTYPANDGNPEDTESSDVLPVDVSIEKNASKDDPGKDEPFIYTLHVQNANTAIARNVRVVDEIDERLNISTVTNDGNWSCSRIGHKVSCTQPELEPGHDSEITIFVTPTVGNVEIPNEAEISTTTYEHGNLGNNHASYSINVGSGSGSGMHDWSKFSDFSLRSTATYYGDLKVIGNSNLISADGNTSGKLADIETRLARTSEYTGGYSTANLQLQPYQKVRYARLYWTGHLHGAKNDTGDSGTDESFKTVWFHTPDGGRIEVESDENSTFYYYYKSDDDTFRRIYSASADVTWIFLENNLSSGEYGVEGIRANTGTDIHIPTPILDRNGSVDEEAIRFGHFGGWSLVVFYEVDHREHREEVFRNINLYDGFQKLVPARIGSEQLTIPVSDFITPKFGDTIKSTLSLFAAGGEKNIELDSISMISRENNVSSEVKISDSANPENNVLNGSISRDGANVTDRNPVQDYNIGIDNDQFDISSDFSVNKIYFGHLQQDTNITLSVGRELDPSDDTNETERFDQSFPTAIGLSTQIYNPDFIDSYKECFVEDPLTGVYKSCSDVNITRGGEIVYRITIVNTGDEKASNVVIEDPLPKEVDFNISTTDLKVVTNSKPLCAGLDTSAESINACVHHLETLGVFDHRVLTDTGKSYIKTYFNSDINQTNNRLYGDGDDNLNNDIWDNAFHDYNITTIDDGRTKLTIDLSNELNKGEGDEYEGYFPALNVTWIEFKVKVNTKAVLNKTFENIAYINFTNPTLAAYGYPDATQRQESASVESPPVVFQWTSLQGDIRDPGRVSVGTKIVNHPFDLNVSIDDSNSSFASFAANYPDVNLTVAAIALVDIDQIPSGGTCKNYMSTTTLAAFNRPYYGSDGVPDFDILSNEYVPIGSGMYWLTDSNISTAIAAREIGFCLLFRMSYKDGAELKFADAPDFYGPFGDHFAARPERIDFDTGLPKTGDYYVVKAGEVFTLDANATDGLTAIGTPGYTTLLSAGDIGDDNTSLNTLSIFDEKGCIDYKLGDPSGVKVHFHDFNFTNGDMAAIANNKFDDVGLVTLRVRDANWTEIDITNGDCNNTSDDDQNGSFVSCAVKGEAKFIFVPARLDVQTTVNNQGNGFTYMANDLDAMHTTIHTKVRALNLEGNVTEAFKSGCYADDVNLTMDANITFSSAETQPYTINWKVDGESTINTLSLATGGIAGIAYTIGESNFTNGEADLDFLINVARTTNHAYYPLDMDTLTGKTLIDNYLGYVDVPESTSMLDADNVARFWYARLHAPDYRSNTTTVETPIYIEVFCNNDKADCSQWGINGLPESSDDVDWWVNANHSGAHLGLLFDMNATQKSVLDPLIKINGGGNVVNDLNQSFSGGVYVPTVTYTGSSNLYRTKINTAPSSWLKYNRFFPDGRTFYHVEFNLQSDDWSGIGERGETVETNGSRKSNRRLEW